MMLSFKQTVKKTKNADSQPEIAQSKKPSVFKRACKKVTRVISKVMPQSRSVSVKVNPQSQSESQPDPESQSESETKVVSEPMDCLDTYKAALEDIIQEQASKLNDLFAEACIGAEEMTEEEFLDSLDVGKELAQLVKSYMNNLQLLQSIDDEDEPVIDCHQEYSDFCVMDLSWLFWDATDESLYLDTLFGVQPCNSGSVSDLLLDSEDDMDLTMLFAEESPSVVLTSKPTAAPLTRSCSMEALTLTESASHLSTTVKDMVNLFERLSRI